MTNSPNIVFILCDQLRADFLPAYGCAGIRTPNLDALAAESLVYDRALSTSPLCVPARAALLTGQTPLQSGVLSNDHWLRPDRQALGVRTWPDLLRDRGYRTAAIGKMHFHPFESSEGFDERIISEDKRWTEVHDDYAEFLAQRGLAKFDPRPDPAYQENRGAVFFPHGVELSVDRFVSNAACDHIRRQPEGRPFALMVGFPSPHCPYDPSPEFIEGIDPEELPDLLPEADTATPERQRARENFLAAHRAPWHSIDYASFSTAQRKQIRVHYAGLIQQLDEEVGRIVAACTERGIWDDTIFIFTSDHGDHVGDHGKVGKGDFHDVSIHIPLFVRIPDQPAGRVATTVELSQTTASILNWTGGVSPQWAYPPLPSETTEDRPVFGVLAGGCMVEEGPFKFVHYRAGFRELFNLKADPQERHNLINDPGCAPVRERLAFLLIDWLLANGTAGHAEKILSRGTPLVEQADFGRSGWTRTYPMPIGQ